MAEDKKDKPADDKEKSDNIPADGGDKATNRVFTQSEYDRAVAQQMKRANDLEAQMKATNEKLAEFEKQRKEKELAEMSELEKANTLNKELQAQIEGLNGKIQDFQKMELKNNVLLDPKYTVLPAVYKKAIAGDTEEDLKASADAIVEQYNNDIAKLGVDKPNIGVPNLKTDDPAKKPIGVKAILAEKLKQHLS